MHIHEAGGEARTLHIDNLRARRCFYIRSEVRNLAIFNKKCAFLIKLGRWIKQAGVDVSGDRHWAASATPARNSGRVSRSRQAMRTATPNSTCSKIMLR